MLNAFLRADDKRKRPGMVWWAAQEPEVTAQGHWGSPAGAPRHAPAWHKSTKVTNPPPSSHFLQGQQDIFTNLFNTITPK